jgi:hypothetical protein
VRSEEDTDVTTVHTHTRTYIHTHTHKHAHTNTALHRTHTTHTHTRKNAEKCSRVRPNEESDRMLPLANVFAPSRARTQYKRLRRFYRAYTHLHLPRAAYLVLEHTHICTEGTLKGLRGGSDGCVMGM